ncbi:MAG: hypothetical protein OQK51_00595 [Kangiellaceae bacterium]|nr:hypothetical protein [Kangiellaceae bacterium]
MRNRTFHLALFIVVSAFVSGCSTTQEFKRTTEKYSASKIEKKAYKDVAQIVLKDGKTQQVVINSIDQKYLWTKSKEKILLEQIEKISLIDEHENFIAEAFIEGAKVVILVHSLQRHSAIKLLKKLAD